MRRHPLVVLGVVALVTGGYLLAGQAYGPILLVFMLAVYHAARHATGPALWWSLAASLVLILAHVAVTDRPLGWLGIVPASAWVVVPAAAGYALRLRHAAAEQARAEAIRQRVGDERLRVAREVHDIVGHGLAAIKMQADIALHVGARRPAQAREALEAISRTSGQALDELRATLASVREGDRSPTPGLDGLEPLRRRLGDAGIEISVRVDGQADPGMPAAVDLAGYRVVQESLTNALRHGTGGRADVTVRHEPGHVAITVVNPFPGTAPGSGTGIPGMRARVEALGGEFRAGPAAGSFEVHARLPTGSAA
ncbi:sensor histidine kinase [Actinoplanes sp. RD1]|uniref:sensor histidine kinase n=1 Tax=Actinoplanes sp. RD1 TaxID=3064538 RepID=UPI002740AB39|nr:histidine kinase [Actinoplanes sp. RD1]